MSLLEDARRLLERLQPVYEDMCDVCQAVRPDGPTGTPLVHRPTCAWLSMPKIAAALEDRERLRAGIRRVMTHKEVGMYAAEELRLLLGEGQP